MDRGAHQNNHRRGRARRKGRFSPITRRILAVNVFALAVLVSGLLYVGQYREGLIRTEIAALTTQADLIAAALGEAAVSDGDSENPVLAEDVARQIVRRLAATSRTRAQLIDTRGRVVSDSQFLVGPGGTVRIDELPPPGDGEGLGGFVLGAYERAARWFRGASGRGPGLDDAGTGSQLPETRLALAGEHGSGVQIGPDGEMIISVAAPVQRYKRVLGALLLFRDSREIDEAVFQVRMDILKMFGVALLITVLLSVYLAGTIARPLRRLSLAADRVRHGLSRQYRLPDLSGRQDEIGDLGWALREMTEALWDRMDAIEGFAADVAHEIKNPLTSLRSAVETAARVSDPEQQRKLMAIIQDDVSRLDRLITDISDASRLDAELSRAEMATVDIAGLVATLKDAYGATAEERKTSLVLDAEDNLPCLVTGLEDRLVQVFRNLIGNALSFSPEGGRITLRIRRRDDDVRVLVEDHGPGIPAGAEEQIFERFYQERPASEKFGTHSGLGLSISKQIVEAHGGSIRAENYEDFSTGCTGARFVVELPLGPIDTPNP